MKALILGKTEKPSWPQRRMIEVFTAGGWDVEYRCVTGPVEGREIQEIRIEEAMEIACGTIQ